MALSWVKANIATFEGDSERITIFGISAGGWSVSAHMVSPLSKGLFTRAISQSGSLYGLPLETRAERARNTRSLAERLDCPTGTGEAILECLRGQPAQELHDTAIAALYLPLAVMTVGGEFLPQPLTHLYDSHQIHPGVDYTMGMMSEEGAIVLLLAAPSLNQMKALVQNGLGFNTRCFQLLPTLS